MVVAFERSQIGNITYVKQLIDGNDVSVLLGVADEVVKVMDTLKFYIPTLKDMSMGLKLSLELIRRYLPEGAFSRIYLDEQPTEAGSYVGGAVALESGDVNTAGMAFFRIKPKSAGVRVYWAQELPASMTAAEAQNYNVTAVVESDGQVIEGGKVHIFAGASCIGQGLGTVLTQMVCDQTGISPEQVVYERSNTFSAPDSGTTSGSRQTLFTGEACRRACVELKKALEGKTLADLNGTDYYGEYATKTDPLGADVPNPISHIAYGYATQMCELGEDGKILRIVAAHDVGKAVNPRSVEGQIEGGVVMSMGFALTERYPLTDCRPTAKYGTLGLFRANQIPEITPIIVEKAGLNVACGAIGIGEITSIPTAPAIADAYYRYDGKFRTSLPLEGTPYSRK